MPAPKISVIIPIYNAEAYLAQCLSSIANQTFCDFEVLMIDDGSTDGSAEICRTFAGNDARFRYHFKANGGAASARNQGLSLAEGEYLAFVDSDDTIDPDYFETLAAPLNGTDYALVQCGMHLHRSGTAERLTPAPQTLDGREFILQVLRRQFPIFLLQTTVTKLYRRDVIAAAGLTFDPEITISEDCLFNTQLLLAEPGPICFLDTAGYHYMQDHSTLTKASMPFARAMQSLRVGAETAAIRATLIERLALQNDPAVQRGFSQAICIINLSNAHLIETGNYSKEEKAQLYARFFSGTVTPVLPAAEDYTGTDKKIILAAAKKDAASIRRIYKLRSLKARLHL